MKLGDLLKVTYRGPTRGPTETVIGICLVNSSLPTPAFTDPVNCIDVLTSKGIRHFSIWGWDFEIIRKL